MHSLTLRLATAGDAPAISAMINSLMPHLTLHADGQGAEAFIASMTAAAIAGYIGDARYRYQVAWLDETMAGVIAVRDNAHVFHMFVAEALHGQGLARQMWAVARAAALAAGNPGAFTVNASRGAAPVYACWGFIATGVLVEQHGIAYMPMRLA